MFSVRLVRLARAVPTHISDNSKQLREARVRIALPTQTKAAAVGVEEIIRLPARTARVRGACVGAHGILAASQQQQHLNY